MLITDFFFFWLLLDSGVRASHVAICHVKSSINGWQASIESGTRAPSYVADINEEKGTQCVALDRGAKRPYLYFYLYMCNLRHKME